MKWKSWIFDCDGVLLNSNGVKRKAMYQAALAYGEENALRLIDFHIKNGGIGREIKFRWFLTYIMGINDNLEEKIAELKYEYSKNLWDGLLSCEEAPKIRETLLELKKQDVSIFVVSGADQDELRQILLERELFHIFDGVFGSPDSKDEILAREINAGTINRSALFLGDSLYDYESSKRARLDFIFIYGWSDVVDWREFVMENNINFAENIEDIANQKIKNTIF